MMVGKGFRKGGKRKRRISAFETMGIHKKQGEGVKQQIRD